MPDFYQTPRFQLPDDLEPEGTVCVRFRVPDDPQYIAQIIGLVDMLKWSRNFAHDETKIGAATVSRTWQAALESFPVEVENCMPYLLRQNPADPCQKQQSTDGGETWTLAWDDKLCQQVITFPAPFVGSGTGAEDAAANVIQNLQKKLIQIADDNCGLDRELAIGEMTLYLRSFMSGFANVVGLGAVFDEYCALSSEEKLLWQEDCQYDEQWSDLKDCSDADGLFDWLNCGAAMLQDWLNDTGSDLMNALNQVAATLDGNTFQQMAGNGAAGGGAGFAACDPCFGETSTERDYDFTTSDDSFYAVVHAGSPSPMGVYTSGAWHTTYYPGPDNAVSIVRDLTRDTLITRLKLFGELTGGHPNRNMTILAHRVVENDWLELAQITEYTTPYLDYGTNSCEWEGCLLVDKIKLVCSFSQGPGGDAQWLTAYECDYIGSDPF